MKLADIPHNVGYHIDEDLREVPDDPAEMGRAIDFLLGERRRISINDAELMSINGLLGVICRIVGDLESAYIFTREAISTANKIGNKQASVQNEIRLATVLQWQGKYRRADEMYQSVALECSLEGDLRRYLDFALQHFGKSLFEQRRYHEAAYMFSKALEFRLEGGNEELIASSRLALAAAESRLHR